MKASEISLFRLWPQWLAAFILSLLTFMMGTSIGWVSPFLGNLSRENPPFEVTKEQTTWIASLSSLGRPVGIILSSIITNLFGTRTSLWIGGFFYVFAFILLIVADSIFLIFGNLILVGIGAGFIMTIASIYLSEIANPKIRGSLSGVTINGYAIGLFMGNLLGAKLTPRAFGVVNLTVVSIYLVIFLFIPSTPYYFVNRSNMEVAKKSIQWYDRYVDADVELEKLTKFLATSPRLSYFQELREVIRPLNLKTLLMVGFLFGFSQFCGLLTIIEYSEIIFINAKVTVVHPATLVTIMTAITIPSGWIPIYTSDKFGRTTTLLASCCLMFLAFGAWGVDFCLLDFGFENPNFQWIIIVGAFVFRVSYVSGFFSTRQALTAELFAPNVTNICCTICNIILTLCAFISNKNFQILIDHLTFKYTFGMFAVLILLVGIYVKIFFPETRGKSLQEIQEMMNPKKSQEEKKNNQDNLKHVQINSVYCIPVVTHL